METTVSINMKDTYRTRDGRKVRILCIDRQHTLYPVVAEDGQVYYYAEGNAKYIAKGAEDDTYKLICKNPDKICTNSTNGDKA